MSREQREMMPEVVRLRDTGLRDDLGGSGQRIITTAGNGYVKTEYVRRDIVDQLRGQLAAAEEREQNVRDRARKAAQILVEEIGADGAVNVEQLAKRACDAIHELRTRAERAEEDAKGIVNVLGFFASCIKSGEPWTEECDKMLKAAFAHRNSIPTP